MQLSGRVWAGVVALTASLAAMPAARAVDLKYLPSDTEIVFTINARQILNSEFVKAHKDKVELLKTGLEKALPPDAHKLLQAAGFDPFKDFGSLMVAMPPSKDAQDVFAVVEGTFQLDKIHAVAEDAARAQPDTLKITRDGNLRIYEITPSGEKRAFACFADNKTLVIAPRQDALKDALARAAGAKKSELKREVKSLLETVNDKQSVSFVITGHAVKKLAEDAPFPNADKIGEVIGNVEGISGAITIAADIQFQIGVGAKDTETAKNFANQANVALGFVKLMAGQAAQNDEKIQPLADAAKTLRAMAQGANLIIRGEISTENLEKLIKNFSPQ